jgi:zinc transporter ZupT
VGLESGGLLYSALSELAIPIGGIIALLFVEVGKYYISTVAFVFVSGLIILLGTPRPQARGSPS